MIKLIVFLGVCLSLAESQLIRQCTCQEIDMCRQSRRQNMANGGCFQQCRTRYGQGQNGNFDLLHHCWEQERQRPGEGCFNRNRQ